MIIAVSCSLWKDDDEGSPHVRTSAVRARAIADFFGERGAPGAGGLGLDQNWDRSVKHVVGLDIGPPRQGRNPVRTVELAEVATEINVSPQQVWAVLTDFPHYPVWSTYIQEIDWHTDVGTKLRVVQNLSDRQGRVVVHCPLIEATPGVRLAWAPVLPGAAWRLPKAIYSGVHEFILTALPDGGTRFVQREHVTGLVANWTKKQVPGIGEDFAAFNTALKHRAEKLA